MRIIAGKLRGRTLVGPPQAGVRPTSDRVRGAIFNILAHSIDDFAIDGVRVLDLFAGTGALGLEALSRRATFCLFVERRAEARHSIRTNIEALGLDAGAARISSFDAARLPPPGRDDRYGLIFIDPPYAQHLANAALTSASAGGWLAANAVVVVEERAGAALAWPTGFTVLDERRWGDTQVVFARYRA